jgi:hypothetical protein
MSGKEGSVVVKYDTPSSVNVEDFIKTALKEMLIADSDTLHLLAEVENPDKTVTKIKFDLVITELTNGGG